MPEKQGPELKFSCLWPYVLPVTAVVLCSCNHTLQAGSDGRTSVADGREYATIAENGQTTTVAMTEGEKASYPTDLPFAQYPGSRVTLSMLTQGKPIESVNLETADTPDKAVAYYKTWFANNGWKIVQQSSTSGMVAISAQSGDKLASIMSMPGTGVSGQSSIQITLSSNK